MINHARLDGVTLSLGAHADKDEGLCLVEAAALLAGEAHTDRPPCVPLLCSLFAQVCNDATCWTTDAQRTAALLPLAATLVQAKHSAEATRARMHILTSFAWQCVADTFEGTSVAERLSAMGLPATPEAHGRVAAVARTLADEYARRDVFDAASSTLYALHACCVLAQTGRQTPLVQQEIVLAVERIMYRADLVFLRTQIPLVLRTVCEAT